MTSLGAGGEEGAGGGDACRVTSIGGSTGTEGTGGTPVLRAETVVSGNVKAFGPESGAGAGAPSACAGVGKMRPARPSAGVIQPDGAQRVRIK